MSYGYKNRDLIRQRVQYYLLIQNRLQSSGLMGLAFHLFPSNDPPLHYLSKELPQYNNPLEENSQLISDIEEEFSISDHEDMIVELFVPKFKIKRTPFKCDKLKIKQKVINNWIQVFEIETFVTSVLDFLGPEQYIMLKQCSKSLKKEITLKLLKNYNNWNLTLTVLNPFISQQTILKQSGMDDDYEHSEDLDRTSGYYQHQNTEDIIEHQTKLNRVLTTISFKVKYFQGIMPICVNLLQFFNEDLTYWMLKYLLAKCSYIQIDMDLYFMFLQKLEEEFKKNMPFLYYHLQKLGFQLNYFVMKWVMGLFSQDVQKNMLLAIWDLICQTQVNVLIYVILQIFMSFQQKLLESNEDEVNHILKINLKLNLNNIDLESFINKTKLLYIQSKGWKK